MFKWLAFYQVKKKSILNFRWSQASSIAHPMPFDLFIFKQILTSLFHTIYKHLSPFADIALSIS